MIRLFSSVGFIGVITSWSNETLTCSHSGIQLIIVCLVAAWNSCRLETCKLTFFVLRTITQKSSKKGLPPAKPKTSLVKGLMIQSQQVRFPVRNNTRN